ncbi:MAG: FAD-binding oxidoreductase [Pseudomonadota bacterium]|jgi:FAD/FMN-containing dehydrogenase
MNPMALHALLAPIVGPAGVLLGKDAAPYEVDHRRLYQGHTPLVVRPRTTAQVAAVLRVCAAHGIAMVPHGGNTSYCGGATPDASGTQIVISLERLTAVRSVDPIGGTLTVEAGCTLRSVRAAAAAAGRHFPLSLGSEGSCQIGGNLSTNAGGTQVLRHGMIRELVLGLEVVLPDGQILDQLRRLRKDNTGYDVKQLFIGAEGTLGIITAAVLRMGPAPADSLTALVAIDGLEATLALLGRIQSAFGDLIETFEYMPASAVALACQHFSQIKNPFEDLHPAFVLVHLPLPSALTGLHEAFTRFMGAEIEACRVRDAVVAQSMAQADTFWFLRENIPAAQTREGASLKHDVSLPLDRLAEFERRGQMLLATLAPGCRSIGYGHAGDGNLHYNVSPPVGVLPGSEEEQAFLSRKEPLMRAIHDLVAELGGSFSAEHGIGQLKVSELVRYEDPVALAVMGRIKQALDPQGLMNPGKVVVGR